MDGAVNLWLNVINVIREAANLILVLEFIFYYYIFYLWKFSADWPAYDPRKEGASTF